MRSALTSRTTTGWPRSAKQAAVTRPTQPAPKIPSGSFPGIAVTLLRAQGLQPLGDGEHRLVRHAVEERVRHPVRGAVLGERDHVELGAVVEELVVAAADRPRERRPGEDRRVLPRRL